MKSAPQLIVLMISDIQVRVTVNARLARRSAPTEASSLPVRLARSRCSLFCALTVAMFRITSNATPSASVWAAEKRAEASVTGFDLITISHTNSVVKTAIVSPTGQATISSTMVAASTVVTIRSIPQLSSSIDCISAHENVESVEDTSPEG